MEKTRQMCEAWNWGVMILMKIQNKYLDAMGRRMIGLVEEKAGKLFATTKIPPP